MTECKCGKPISESTAHVPCVDCGTHVLVAVNEAHGRWLCGMCNAVRRTVSYGRVDKRTRVGHAVSVRVAGDEQDRP